MPTEATRRWMQRHRALLKPYRNGIRLFIAAVPSPTNSKQFVPLIQFDDQLPIDLEFRLELHNAVLLGNDDVKSKYQPTTYFPLDLATDRTEKSFKESMPSEWDAGGRVPFALATISLKETIQLTPNAENSLSFVVSFWPMVLSSIVN